MTLRFGFMESPNVPKALAIARKQGWTLRHHVDLVLPVPTVDLGLAHSGMPLWQDRIFISLARNADDASNYFRIPTDRVVEIGTQVTI